MKIYFKYLMISIFVLLNAFPAKAQDDEEQQNKPGLRERFFVDLLNFYNGNPDNTLLNVFVQVPYNEIQFYKSNDQFIANYTVTISVFNEDKDKLIEEKIWKEKITTKDFKETTSRKNYNLSLKEFLLKPETYYVRVSVEDNNSKNSYLISKIIDIRKFSAELDISDILIVSNKVPDSDNKKIIPNVSRSVVSKNNGVPFYFEIYSNSRGKAKIDYSILNQSDKAIIKESKSYGLNIGPNKVFYTIKDSLLNLGTYTIEIKVENEDNGKDAEITGKFTSRWAGVPTSVTDLDKAVDQLVYISTKKELEYIEDSPNREVKIKRFSEFWKARDPNPSDDDNQAFDEYYRRVAYANDNFTHYVEGWRTDMGMVFIVLGMPDNIDRHPFDPDSKPYEIWQYYNLNRSFGFKDTTGFGDYRLMNPLDFDYIRGRDY